MKPWFTEICERVKNGTALPDRIGDATAIIENWGYDWNEDDGLANSRRK